MTFPFGERVLLMDADMRANRLVGARIHTVRKKHSMTLRQLAHKTRVPPFESATCKFAHKELT